jgi:transcriptional regulator with XRE-family HTH domain
LRILASYTEYDITPVREVQKKPEKSLKLLYNITHLRIMNAYMNGFYRRVAERLLELGRKRSWLLGQTGIKPSTWSSWEKHDRFPPADRAVAIAQAIELPVEYLVTGSEMPLPPDRPSVAAIARRLLQMDDRQLDQVVILINSMSVEGPS